MPDYEDDACKRISDAITSAIEGVAVDILGETDFKVPYPIGWVMVTAWRDLSDADSYVLYSNHTSYHLPQHEADGLWMIGRRMSMGHTEES